MEQRHEENWLANYQTFKQLTLEHGHFPNCFVEYRNLALYWFLMC